MIDFIIPTYQRSTETIRAVYSCVPFCKEYGGNVIVSDNGSSDGSFDILKNEFLESTIVRCISAPSSVFGNPALNWLHGLEGSDADYVQLLFSDDVLLPSYKILYEFLSLVNMTGTVGKEIFVASKVNFCSFRGMSTGSYFEIFSNKIFPTSKEFFFEFFKNNYLAPRSPGAYLISRPTALRALTESIDAFKDRSFAIKTGAGIDLLMLILAAKGATDTFINSQASIACFGVHDKSFTIQHGSEILPLYHEAIELSHMPTMTWYGQLKFFLFYKIYRGIFFSRSTVIKLDRFIRYLFYLIVRRLSP